MQLATMFRQQATDIMDVDWKTDQTYRDAQAAEDTAKTQAATLDAEYIRLSREINAGSEIIRTPPPGHPIAAVQYASNQADRAAQLATRAREQAETQAKAAVQPVGEEARRAGWPAVENAIDQLIVQLNAFQALQAQVYDRTDVKPVEISSAVGMNEQDLVTWMANVRTVLGLGR